MLPLKMRDITELVCMALSDDDEEKNRQQKLLQRLNSF